MQLLRQRRKTVWLVSYVLYPIMLLLVIRLTPLAGSNITELMDNSSYEMMTRPFHFTYCSRTVPVALLFTVIYFIGFYIYVSSMKNVRPGEEYGSASWTEPKTLSRKYKTRKGEEKLSKRQQRKLKREYIKTLIGIKLGIPIGDLFLLGNETSEEYKDRCISEIDKMIGMPAWRLDMILSKNVKATIRTKTDNINTLILGGSGRGKTRAYIIPNIMQLNSSFVCTDPKGEICKKTGKLLKRFGYDVRVLDLKNHDKSHGYNPFEYFRNDNDILLFANNMWGAMEDKTATKGDPTWPELARAMLLSFMLYLYHYAPPEEQNFDMVVEMMHKVKIDDDKSKTETASELDKLFERIPHDDTAYGYYKDWSNSRGRTLASIYVTLSAKLSVFNLESMRKLTFKDEMGILDLATKKVAVFLIIPDDNAVYNFLAGTLYTQMFQQLYEYADSLPGGALPEHVRFYMDEFANIALPNDYQKILSTARSRNMSFVIVLQDKQQIEAIFEKYYKTLYGNCSFYLFLGSNEYDTCEYYSKLLGKETIVVENWTRNYGRGGGMSKAETRVGRELMTPNELSHLSKRKCVIYSTEDSACIDQKADMTQHRYYRYIADGARTKKNNYDWGEETMSEGTLQLLGNDYLGEMTVIEGKNSNGWVLLDPSE